MEPTPQIPEEQVPATPPTVTPPAASHPWAHTYQDDLAQAMDVTDPASVQKMLADARRQETGARGENSDRTARRWYSVSSVFLILLTLIILAGGTYYYMHMTVPVQPVESVGVFESSQNIDVTATTIQEVLRQFGNDTTLPIGKPILINLVTDAQSNALISNSQLYAFIGAAAPEPFQAAFATVRLGEVNTGKGIVPFLIASVTDPERASRELTIAEPTLLQLFSPALGITTDYENLPPTFQSQYFYNIPVRSFDTVADPLTGQKKTVFLYGYTSGNTVVITTDPLALKAVYDTIITQD